MAERKQYYTLCKCKEGFANWINSGYQKGGRPVCEYPEWRG